MSSLLFLPILLIHHAYSDTITCAGDECICSPSYQGQKCTLNCEGQGKCQGSSLQCRQGDPCQINCVGLHACYGAVFHGGDATDLNITCNGYPGEACHSDSSLLAILLCGDGDCRLYCSDGACHGIIVVSGVADIWECSPIANCKLIGGEQHPGEPSPFIAPTPYPTPHPTNPTISPTGDTIHPTVSPTANTVNPTSSPSNNPSNNPSITPTVSPTGDTMHPTVSPTANTVNPTAAPSVSPTTLEQTDNPSLNPTTAISTNSPSSNPTQPSLNPSVSPTTLEATAVIPTESDEIPLFIVAPYGFIVSLFVLFDIMSFMDAKCVRKNDYYNYKIIIIAMFEILDMLSDILFAEMLTTTLMENNDGSMFEADKSMLLSVILSYLFILLPIIFGLYLLVKESRKYWLIQDDNLRCWLTEHSKELYLLSIVTGSSFTAINIVNCNAFQVETFCMGLNKMQRIRFNGKRLYAVVFCENVPQIALQIWYLYTNGYDLIPIIFILFGLISVVITILALITQKHIMENQQFVKISFDVNASDITPKLQTKTNGIKSEIAALVGVSKNLLEIPRPHILSTGLKIDLFLYVNDINYKHLEYQTKMNNATKNGTLIRIFKQNWSLNGSITIGNLQFKQTKSRFQNKNTVIIELNKQIALERFVKNEDSDFEPNTPFNSLNRLQHQYLSDEINDI